MYMHSQFCMSLLQKHKKEKKKKAAKSKDGPVRLSQVSIHNYWGSIYTKHSW